MSESHSLYWGEFVAELTTAIARLQDAESIEEKELALRYYGWARESPHWQVFVDMVCRESDSAKGLRGTPFIFRPKRGNSWLTWSPALYALVCICDELVDPCLTRGINWRRLRSGLAMFDGPMLYLECWHELNLLQEAKRRTQQEGQTTKNTNSEDEFAGIMTLKRLWEKPIGTYKRLIVALDKSTIQQKKQGRRRMVHVAQFARWLRIVEATVTTTGFDPSDRSDWTDEIWDKVSAEFEDHANTRNEIRESKRGA